MLEKQRHQAILTILENRQFASVQTLSSELSSSEATIRRDIQKLFTEGKLKKIRGGAEFIPSDGQLKKPRQIAGGSFASDKEKHTAKKRLIAEKAVSICADNDSIIINAGTSTFMMGEFLCKRSINVLTNSFPLAQYLSENGENQVTLPGGEIYREQGIVLSSFENDTLQGYHGSKMFMGTPGLNHMGVSESDPLLIRAEQKLWKQADKLIVLADSSKLGKKENFIFCPLEQINMLITDADADPVFLAELEALGVEVLIAR